MAYSEFHAGDIVSYVLNGCRYVSIVGGKKDERTYSELVALNFFDMYGDKTEEGFLYYDTMLLTDEVADLRMATDEEKARLMEELEYDGNAFDKERNEIVSCDAVGKKPFIIKRSVKIETVYEDTVEVYAPDIETALERAELKSADRQKIADDICKRGLYISDKDITNVGLSYDVKRNVNMNE